MRVNPIRRCSALFFCTWALVSVASAQNYRPIVDHVHLSAPDPATAVAWYRQHFGGEPMTEGIDRLLYGDVRVVFSRREKTLPSQGSAVDHIGFSVPDIDATMKTLEAAGVKVEGPVRDVAGLFKLAFIEDPWGTRIEVVQDPAKLGVHHIHLRGPDPAAMLAWYSTQFGGRVGKLKDRIDGIDMGGVWILVQRGEAVPTIGHSIDHIGFRPVDVDASVAFLKTQNVKITTEPRPLSFPNGVSVRLAFAEAPDGVRIELVQRPELTAAPQLAYEVRQLTFGPAHHFYGYIGHVGNSPYSADGKYLVALRTTFQDRMPRSDDAADIVLLDVAKNYAEIKVGETRGWNPQQGAMSYWNPEQPSRQFFFNDRDSKTGKVFTALYDIVDRKRVREFRFDESPVANGGVKQSGGAFAAINYARMARLRPVTGYPGAWDWTEGVNHPQDDGLFVVDPKTGGRKLIVSFRQMRDALVAKHPEVDDMALFLNHTLWNREGDRLFFFVRADFNDPKRRVNVPMTVRPDGSELIEQRIFIGGHPEWDFKSRMIGRVEDKLVLYDTLSQQIVETIGGPEMFRDPEGDTALSRDGKWIVNGATTGATMHYTVLRRADRAFIHTENFSRAGYVGGDLRIDPAPCWNREGDRFVFPALAKDGTRQMFEVRVLEKK